MSLHAEVAVPARDRQRLERLCRYVARPPARQRATRGAPGWEARAAPQDPLARRNHPYSDGAQRAHRSTGATDPPATRPSGTLPRSPRTEREHAGPGRAGPTRATIGRGFDGGRSRRRRPVARSGVQPCCPRLQRRVHRATRHIDRSAPPARPMHRLHRPKRATRPVAPPASIAAGCAGPPCSSASSRSTRSDAPAAGDTAPGVGPRDTARNGGIRSRHRWAELLQRVFGIEALRRWADIAQIPSLDFLFPVDAPPPIGGGVEDVCPASGRSLPMAPGGRRSDGTPPKRVGIARD
jgi:hypothetical protein